MFQARVESRVVEGVLVAEFWDCPRLALELVQSIQPLAEQHIAAGGKPSLAIDLCGVGFAGSAALGGFIALQRLCASHGGRVAFFGVEPIVREVFRLSQLDRLFTFADDLNEALTRLNAPAEKPAPSPPPLRRRRPTGTEPSGP